MPSPRSPRRPAAADDQPGLPVRRAALRLLDAVLRRGEPLELALHAASQGLAGSDRSLVHAIVAETLRHLPDLDALIDGATRQRLPDDAKARMVLRIALAQALVIGERPLVEEGVHFAAAKDSRFVGVMPRLDAAIEARRLRIGQMARE